MHLLGRGEQTLLVTHLAERMCLDVSVTDTFPRTTIAFVGLGVTLIFVVGFVCIFLMLGTVLLARVTEPTATVILARVLWFVWHRVHLTFGHKESHQGFLPNGCMLIFYYNIITHTLCQVVPKCANFYFGTEKFFRAEE